MIYLDHAATTRVLPSVRMAMLPWLDGEYFGNPSTLHSAGRAAKEAIEGARHDVMRLINADKKEEIIFTSGGTESDNMAIMGMVPYLKRVGKTTVVMSAIEHHAILNLQKPLVDAGMTVKILPVDQFGRVNVSVLHEYLQVGDVGLVSVMLANNEIGVVQKMSVISSICHQCDCLVHTDAVQAVGHMVVDVKSLGVDLLSMSGHKFGTVQGIGALYVKASVMKNISPIIIGGGQERGMRSGTESVAAIVGLGAAARNTQDYLSEYIRRYAYLKSTFVKAMEDNGCMSRVNSDFDGMCLPNILSITNPGIEAEALLRLMDADGVCISAASACSAGSLEPSHVLTAIGMSAKDAHCTIRISFGSSNTSDDVETAALLLAKNIKKLRSMFA